MLQLRSAINKKKLEKKKEPVVLFIGRELHVFLKLLGLSFVWNCTLISSSILTIIDHQDIFWKIYFDELCFDARLIELVIVLELTILYGLPRWQWNSEFYLVSLFIFIIKFVWSILLGWWITFFVYYGIFGGGGVALINVSKELDKLHATCNRWCQSLEFSFYRMLLRCLSLFLSQISFSFLVCC